MANGDTKTEALLNILGNGGSGDEYRGCCNTKTQQYILDAIDRVQDVEDEVEELKNNPDVVDIVDTYADLQAYDTQHLTDNDIIRVLADETHSGNSTYYRFTKNPDTWTFIGEISGGGGGEPIHELTADDYNWNSTLNSATEPYDCVALWLMPAGWYSKSQGSTVWVVKHANPNGIESFAVGTYFVGVTEGTGVNARRPYLYSTYSDKTHWHQSDIDPGTGREYDDAKMLTADDLTIVQTTGTSTTDVMSQKAVTDALASAGGGVTQLTTADYNWPVNDPQGIAYWLLDDGVYYAAAGVRFYYGSASSQWNATERVFIVESEGSSYKTATSLEPHQINYYRNNVSTGDASGGYPYTVLTTNSVVQSTGTSTSNVMSQNATTSMVYNDPATKEQVKIGNGAVSSGSTSTAVGDSSRASAISTTAIGAGAYATAGRGVAIGAGANARYIGSIAIGADSITNSVGEMNIGTSTTSYGYNSSNYRLLTGVHDPVNAHDAATKGYVDSLIQELTNNDLNYDFDEDSTNDGIALWLLPTGLYLIKDLDLECYTDVDAYDAGTPILGLVFIREGDISASRPTSMAFLDLDQGADIATVDLQTGVRQ